jgi:hypothetical protein
MMVVLALYGVPHTKRQELQAEQARAEYGPIYPYARCGADKACRWYVDRCHKQWSRPGEHRDEWTIAARCDDWSGGL